MRTWYLFKIGRGDGCKSHIPRVHLENPRPKTRCWCSNYLPIASSENVTQASSVPIITSECGAMLSSAKAVSITINYQLLINKS